MRLNVPLQDLSDLFDIHCFSALSHRSTLTQVNTMKVMDDAENIDWPSVCVPSLPSHPHTMTVIVLCHYCVQISPASFTMSHRRPH